MSVQEEIGRAQHLGKGLEELVLCKEECPSDDRSVLLIGYWSLIFDYHKGILCLIENGFSGAAFALVRPIVEVVIRAHVVVKGSNQDLERIKNDGYRVDFNTIGKWIDTEFGLDNFFENFLRRITPVLHSYTHSGVYQLGRRFSGSSLKANYGDGEIIEVIRTTTSVTWMVTNLVTKYFKFEDAAKTVEEMYAQWGKQSN